MVKIKAIETFINILRCHVDLFINKIIFRFFTFLFAGQNNASYILYDLRYFMRLEYCFQIYFAFSISSSILLSSSFGVVFDPNLFITFPCESMRNFVKFHFIALPNNPEAYSFK